MWTDLSSVLSQSTRSTDGETVGQTHFSRSPRWHYMQCGKTWNLWVTDRLFIRCSRLSAQNTMDNSNVLDRTAGAAVTRQSTGPSPN